MRLIDADALLTEANADGAYGYVDAEQIANAPTIEAEPVKHGWWLPQVLLGQLVFICSGCKTLGSPVWKRCPVCEAKMDLEVDHAQE